MRYANLIQIQIQIHSPQCAFSNARPAVWNSLRLSPNTRAAVSTAVSETAQDTFNAAFVNQTRDNFHLLAPTVQRTYRLFVNDSVETL